MRHKTPLLALAASAVVATFAIAANFAGAQGTDPRTDNKIEICHKTGQKNGSTPRYVEISVSINAVGGHSRHGDTLPVAAGLPNAGTCPGTVPVSTVTGGQNPRVLQNNKMQICHRTGETTGSPPTPKYVKISVSESALRAHARHRDTLPVGAGQQGTQGSCPGPTLLSTLVNTQTPATNASGQGKGKPEGKGKGKRRR